jgi:HEAT repeat protein
MSRAESLRDYLERESDEVLLWQLGSSGPERQRRIAFELGRRRASKAVPDLRKLLASPEARVREAAVEALGR